MSRFALLSSGLFALVAGCGDDGAARPPDAPPPPDGATDATPAGAVTITTHVRCCDVAPLTPQAGVLVVVVQPDGSLGETGTTDAQGQATLSNVQEGAAISAVYPENEYDETYVSTVVGVKPGDNLAFGDNYFQPYPNGTVGAMTVEVPAFDGASGYEVYSPCGFGSRSGLTFTLQQHEYCQTPTAPIAFWAYDSSNELIASAYLPAAPFTNGAAVTLAAWTPANDLPISLTGLGAQTYGDVYGVAAYPHTEFGDYAGFASSDSPLAENVRLPTTAPRLYAQAYLWRSGLAGRQETFKAGTTQLTLTAPALPWLAGVIVDAESGQAVWLKTAGTSDAAVLRLQWRSRSTPRGGGKGGNDHRYYWNLVLPPDTVSLDFGTPPPALAAFLPTATADRLRAELTFIDLASTADYDAARGAPEWRLTAPESAVAHGDETSAATSYTSDGGEGFAPVVAPAPRRASVRAGGVGVAR